MTATNSYVVYRPEAGKHDTESHHDRSARERFWRSLRKQIQAGLGGKY